MPLPPVLRRQAGDVGDAAGDVGSVARSSRVTAVAAPVRLELKTGSLVPDDGDRLGDVGDLEREVEVLGDAEAQRRRCSSLPGVKPVSDAVTVYGPPTRMPGMRSGRRPA